MSRSRSISTESDHQTTPANRWKGKSRSQLLVARANKGKISKRSAGANLEINSERQAAPGIENCRESCFGAIIGVEPRQKMVDILLRIIS